MKLSHEVLRLETRHPFVIARGGYAAHENVVVTLRDDDSVEGKGEAAPNRYYGESVATVVAALDQFAGVLARADGWSLETIEAELERTLKRNSSAKSAVSSALHDIIGKRLGVPIWKMWGLDPVDSPLSSFTIGIADNDGLRKKVADAKDYPILKIKLGTDRDTEIVRIVREEAGPKRLRVDANAAWSVTEAIRMIDYLREQDVEFVEQPLPAHDIDGLRFVRERASLPIIADESCLVATDIPRLAGAVDGINIKLAKCGSLREAVRMVHVARAQGMSVMAGCMIESTLGISAIAQLAPLLDYADLDGAALVANDPYVGARMESGRIFLSDAPGLGVSRADEQSQKSAVGGHR